MIFLCLNASVAIIDILMFVLFVIRCAVEFKRRYPGTKIPRPHWSQTLSSAIKMVVTSLCPVFNIILAYVLIFKDDGVMESTIADILKKASESENP